MTALSTRIPDRVSDQAQSVHDLAVIVHGLYDRIKRAAGAGVYFEMECLPCIGSVRISEEFLASILVALTHVLSVALQQGRIRVTLQKGGGGSFLHGDRAMISTPSTALLCVHYSAKGLPCTEVPAAAHGKFELKTVRVLVEEAGGSFCTVPLPGLGTRFEVELPLIPVSRGHATFSADFPERTPIEC